FIANAVLGDWSALRRTPRSYRSLRDMVKPRQFVDVLPNRILVDDTQSLADRHVLPAPRVVALVGPIAALDCIRNVEATAVVAQHGIHGTVARRDDVGIAATRFIEAN